MATRLHLRQIIVKFCSIHVDEIAALDCLDARLDLGAQSLEGVFLAPLLENAKGVGLTGVLIFAALDHLLKKSVLLRCQVMLRVGMLFIPSRDILPKLAKIADATGAAQSPSAICRHSCGTWPSALC